MWKFCHLQWKEVVNFLGSACPNLEIKVPIFQNTLLICLVDYHTDHRPNSCLHHWNCKKAAQATQHLIVVNLMITNIILAVLATPLRAVWLCDWSGRFQVVVPFKYRKIMKPRVIAGSIIVAWLSALLCTHQSLCVLSSSHIHQNSTMRSLSLWRLYTFTLFMFILPNFTASSISLLSTLDLLSRQGLSVLEGLMRGAQVVGNMKKSTWRRNKLLSRHTVRW